VNAPICFVDTETAGPDPDRHQIWEVGLITPNGDEHLWQFPVDTHHGCRCDVCCTAENAYKREWRKRQPRDGAIYNAVMGTTS
jgi:hypothetical protein